MKTANELREVARSAGSANTITQDIISRAYLRAEEGKFSCSYNIGLLDLDKYTVMDILNRLDKLGYTVDYKSERKYSGKIVEFYSIEVNWRKG